MTELDDAINSIEIPKNRRVALVNATNDLRSKISYVYNVYKFWDNAPEFGDFDQMHSYLISESMAAPRSFNTNLNFARGSYATVIDELEENNLVSPLMRAVESQPEEYSSYQPISMAFHDEDHRDTREKCVEMYNFLHDSGFYTRMPEHSKTDLLEAGNILGEITGEYHDIIRNYGYRGYLSDGGRRKTRRRRSERIKRRICKAGMILSGAAAIGYDLHEGTGGSSVFAGLGLIFSAGLS